LKLVGGGIHMENGEYYMGIGPNADPNSPTLIVGYRLDGKKVEIYKSRETYVVVNTKTEKFLTCLGLEHARYVFKECIRTLTPEGRA
jgi:hypothetical protein